MRNAFVDILEEKKIESGAGIGIPSIPSLVTSNQHCLVKGNGVPFLAIKDIDQWVAVFSTRHNPAKLILELIWSKISWYFDIKMPWDDGLHMDNIEPLLIAKAVRAEDKVGWIYNSIEFKENRLKRDDNNVWEPATIGKAEMSAINIMAMHGGYFPLDKGMNDYLIAEHQVTVKEVSKNLIFTRLFMKDGECIRPIHNLTHIATLDDDTGYASSERDRFDLWCEQNGVSPNYLNIVFFE